MLHDPALYKFTIDIRNDVDTTIITLISVKTHTRKSINMNKNKNTTMSRSELQIISLSVLFLVREIHAVIQCENQQQDYFSSQLAKYDTKFF